MPPYSSPSKPSAIRTIPASFIANLWDYGSASVSGYQKPVGEKAEGRAAAERDAHRRERVLAHDLLRAGGGPGGSGLGRVQSLGADFGRVLKRVAHTISRDDIWVLRHDGPLT